MNYLEIFRLAVGSLRTNRLRTALTMLGVIIGVASVILLVSIGDGVRIQITREIELLGSNQFWVFPGNVEETQGPPGQGVINRLRYSHLKLIEERNTYGLVVSATLETQGITVRYGGRNRKGVFVIGTLPNYTDFMQWNIGRGRFLVDADFTSARRVAVIGITLARKLFLNTNPLGKRIDVMGQSFEVVGIMQPKGQMFGLDMDNSVFLPLSTMQDVMGTNDITQISMKIPDIKEINGAMAQVRRILATQLNRDDFSVRSQSEFLKTFQNFSRVFTGLLGGIAAISLIVGGIGIMNIMLVSVRERTREIGLRKAVGATERAILLQFLVEAVVISMVGGAIGILLGTLGSLGIARTEVIPARVTLWSVLLAFGFSAAIGIFFGVYPASKAARLDPVEALRYE